MAEPLTVNIREAARLIGCGRSKLYELLKAKDASVDRLPPLSLDMDFADGQGTVILPVSSPVTLISAAAVEPALVPTITSA